ncbi:beta-glucosidase family protein [Streptomyces solicathayae]|uniref:Glycoside hydrolase family 3 C-terminal domain-containing protein n=1 Tax=Streptomyces solicathayae TaxID=3081768 RepID=A0ABZ0M1K7_9ACTN|nr:glycoside hydrolase family 3 C-terminal domain-containing protein [Streptomyces sp. HUAS YS2]WOX25660.1 glycoside hydrolase family 3 C-terminal domain-containing protein [Streptomyces sp. HUAS YS2]
MTEDVSEERAVLRGVTRRSALGLLGAAVALAATMAPALPARARGRRRLDELLEQLTLDEKISLLHGARDPNGLGQAGYVPGVPRLGIPELRLADGPAGVRVRKTATALPAPVMLAAAFDPGLARAYGRVIGREGRALGQDVLLSPMVNLIRTPYAGRNFETFSEDPLLSADLVAEEVRGIQAEGLVATVKHFALNNQERDRTSVDARASERTLHETELRGFEAAVAAGTGAVMAAYNKVNGVHASENAALLSGVLRDRWGFDGWVMSDWDATHSTAPALTAGLDMEMPAGVRFGDPLKAAVADGKVPEAAVDRAVRRVLAVRERFGLLGATPAERPARDAASGANLALRVATAGATLLRNENGALPLSAPAARSLAVVGPTGAVPFVSGGGSAHVVPDAAARPVDALRARAGAGAEVTYALGEDLYGKPLPALTPAASLENRTVAAGATWSHEAVFTVPEGDTWTFVVHYSGERPTVSVDGTELFPVRPGVAEYFTGGLLGRAPDGLHVRRAEFPLTAGEHRLKVTAPGGKAGQRFSLRAITSAGRAADLAEAVSAARAAHTVVLFAYEDATEGRDRTSLALPGHQQALIEAVTAVNPRTVVVLNTSSAVTMPWLERTAAVLQMYYPGQEGAAATTAVLFGDADPGGRLTQTFPAAEGRHPTAGDPHRYPGKDGTEEYSEGVHVGHRWYDAQGVAPLFPFGHGLSYTSFAYSGLVVVPRAGGGLDVTFTVRNTGTRAGTEVAQIYAGPSPDLELDQPARFLAGYRRLELAAGERRRITVPVAARTLSSFDPARDGWVLGTGERTLQVGASSRDVRLSARAEVRSG